MLTRTDNHNLNKRGSDDRHLLPFESMLGEGLRGFLSEFTTINGGLLVSYVCNERHSILADIVASSAERQFRPGTLLYAGEAGIDYDWGEAPCVTLHFEFQARELTAFFVIVLAGDHAGIDIRGIHFNRPLGTCEENLRWFAAALREARSDGPPIPLPVPGTG